VVHTNNPADSSKSLTDNGAGNVRNTPTTPGTNHLATRST
jgi:hypothetical protein